MRMARCSPFGSGSRSQRKAGVLVPLELGGVCAAPRRIDLAPLFGAIELQLGDLNLEGALASGERLLVLQRGNTRSGRNACVELSLPEFLRALETGNVVPGLYSAVIDYDLGAINGVSQGFNDGGRRVRLPRGAPAQS